MASARHLQNSVPAVTSAELLACPRCRTRLTDLNCAVCHIEFPSVGGLPCLFPEPQASLIDWRNRWQLALHELALDEAAAKHSLGQTTLSSTGQRLRRLINGYQQQQQQLRKLLKPLGGFNSTTHATALALKTRLPSHHGLLSYEANIFRDWCWGESENQATCTAITQSWQACQHTQQTPQIAVLGAGAGRLAADIHQHTGAAHTLAVDSNPLLALVAQRLWRGDKLRLTEFPLAPNTLEDCAIDQTLLGSRQGPGLHYLLADALHPPLTCGEFDLVITPWLIDVIDSGVEPLLPLINQLLKPNGVWINSGSLAFAHADPGSCHSLDELRQLACDQGFTEQHHHERQIPYLASPHSRHQRLETLCTTAWVKTTQAAKPKPYQQLPDWLALGDSPIPAIDAFTLQANTTRIHAFIMSLIDGQRSLQDIAQVLAEHKLMTAEDGQVALRGFLLKMVEEAAARSSR